MQKNIIVIDPEGKDYGPTYLRRAEGLVKCGRARWVDESKICLTTCPPIKNDSEDIKMDDSTKNVTCDTPIELSMDYVTSRIDKIISSNDHIIEAIKSIGMMQVNESSEGGYGDKARGDAIAQSVQAREATNQQALKLLEKMYDDLKPQKADSRLTEVLDTLKTINWDEYPHNSKVLIENLLTLRMRQ